MNTELLLKVKAAILAEPLKFNMGVFFTEDNASPCGTAACIAGHAEMIHYGHANLSFGVGVGGHEAHGQIALGLDRHQTSRLFYVECWPRNFREGYDDAIEDGSSREWLAKIAAERIDHFIKTNGEE